MALVVAVRQQDGSVKRLGFVASPVRVGRNMLNEVHLTDPRVSQWHAIIRFDEETGEVLLMDLGSTNGTAQNGTLLEGRIPVEVGPQDVLEIGGHHIGLHMAKSRAEWRPPSVDSNFDANLGTGGNPGAWSSRDGSPHDPDRARLAPSEARYHRSEVQAPPFRQNPTPAPEVTPPGKSRSRRPNRKKSPDQFVHNAVEECRPAYDGYRQGWQTLLRHIQGTLAHTPEHLRESLAQAIESAYPEIAHESDFQRILTQMNLPTRTTGGHDASEWLHRLKTGSRSGTRERINEQIAMERTGALMEAFAESFVALRRGYEQFGEDMGLEVFSERGPLTKVRNHREALQVLLDWHTEGNEAVGGLRRAFTDLAMHQVAVVHGVVEGVRELLHRLSPRELAESQGLPAHNGLFAGRQLWKVYVGTLEALLEEDTFVREIFGQAFARAYFNVAGGTLDEDDDL